MPDNLRSSTNTTDKIASEVLRNKIHNEFRDFVKAQAVLRVFSLQLKDGGQPYQVPPRKVAYALQELLGEELETTEGSKQFSQ